MAKRTLRILHLSDLHIGKEKTPDAWRVERVMGDAWNRNLDEIRADGPIDLVCFTGDLAQSGRSDQYKDIARLIDAVLRSVGCPRERFFCVPGNHDADRSVASDAWTKLRELQWHAPQELSRWMAGGRPPFGAEDAWRDAVINRQQGYRAFLDEAGLSHLRPGQFDNPHPRLGYRRTLDLGLGQPLHIIGFDSAWLAGDDHDAGKLRLTDDQIGRLMTSTDGKRLPGWSIGLIHHPLTDLADARDAQRLLGEYGLDLLLHGHQHDPVVEHRSDPHAGLHVFAAGCLYEHERYPNGLLMVDLELPEAQPLRPRQVWARKWSDRLAEWIDDNELYRGTRNGRLRLSPVVPQVAAPAQEKLVGRSPELDQLRAALLPAARGEDSRPTVICCAIDGMPGVGKTRLAQEFIDKDWREALGQSELAPLADLRVHLALAPDDQRDAESLAAAMLSAYQRVAPPDAACATLRELLRSGPAGRRLLLIENVDGPVQAEQVAALVAQLPGCAVLATARCRDLAGGGWARVPVAPLPREKSIELLRQRIARGRKPYPLDDAEADALAERLGDLPLALQIAGSHLGRGTRPQRFLKQLEVERLALGPAAAGDRRFDGDAARGLIAGAFTMSWALWCEEHDARWQAALVALAHGPAEGVGDALGGAMTLLDADAYEDCTAAADGLSLLDVELVQEDFQSPRRRVRLHPLIAEFLRHQPWPDETAVMERIGDWCDPLLREIDDDAMPAAWAAMRAETSALLHWLARAPKPPSGVAVGNGTVGYAQSNGPYADWLGACARWAGDCEDSQMLGTLRLAESRLSHRAGDPVRSERAARSALDAFTKAGNERNVAIAYGQIAEILQVRGEPEEALRIRQEEQMPVYERLGEVRLRAITQGQIADILQARGELEEALRIRREEELAVYERLGAVHERAITQGQIAYILQARGELEEALRIHRDEILPVVERLGDMKGRAVTQGHIADILQVRGELAQALRIRREEALPVYERLGDVRERAITLSKIADILQVRGELEKALRIRREEVLPAFEQLADPRLRAVEMGKIADIMRVSGELEEAVRIRREEELPVYERLGNVRELLVGRANLALTLVQRGRQDDRPEILALLQQSLADAERLHLLEAQAIRGWIAKIFGPDETDAAPG